MEAIGSQLTMLIWSKTARALLGLLWPSHAKMALESVAATAA